MTGAEIRQRRDALGLTQAELAQALGVTLTTLSRWENGHVTPEHPPMLRLALERLESRRTTDPAGVYNREP